MMHGQKNIKLWMAWVNVLPLLATLHKQICTHYCWSLVSWWESEQGRPYCCGASAVTLTRVPWHCEGHGVQHSSAVRQHSVCSRWIWDALWFTVKWLSEFARRGELAGRAGRFRVTLTLSLLSVPEAKWCSSLSVCLSVFRCLLPFCKAGTAACYRSAAGPDPPTLPGGAERVSWSLDWAASSTVCGKTAVRTAQ